MVQYNETPAREERDDGGMAATPEESKVAQARLDSYFDESQDAIYGHAFVN
jgi:hypothetical protein